MASIVLQMSATGGVADERCAGDDRPFVRGERMNAIQYDDGTPAGWFCDACVDYWTTHGKPPKVEQKGAEDVRE